MPAVLFRGRRPSESRLTALDLAATLTGFSRLRSSTYRSTACGGPRGRTLCALASTPAPRHRRGWIEAVTEAQALDTGSTRDATCRPARFPPVERGSRPSLHAENSSRCAPASACTGLFTRIKRRHRDPSFPSSQAARHATLTALAVGSRERLPPGRRADRRRGGCPERRVRDVLRHRRAGRDAAAASCHTGKGHAKLRQRTASGAECPRNRAWPPAAPAG